MDDDRDGSAAPPSTGPRVGHDGPVSTDPTGSHLLRADPVRLAAQHRFARTVAVVLLATTAWIVVGAVVAALAVEPPLWIGFAACALVLGGLGVLMLGAVRRTRPPSDGSPALARLSPDDVVHLADGTTVALAEVTGIEQRWSVPAGRPGSPGARLGERLVRGVEVRRPELARRAQLIVFHRDPRPSVILQIGPVALPGDVDAFLAELAAAAGRHGIARWTPPPDPSA